MIMVIMIVLMNNLNTRSLCLNRKSSLVYSSESVAFIFCQAKKNSRNVAIYCNCYNWVKLFMEEYSNSNSMQTLVFSNIYTNFSWLSDDYYYLKFSPRKDFDPLYFYTKPNKVKMERLCIAQEKEWSEAISSFFWLTK